MQRVRKSVINLFVIVLIPSCRYSKLHVLDLEWDHPSSFVDFVQMHVRQGLKTKQFRSSNLKELFSLLHQDHPPLALVRSAADKFATWSLTFGVAQVDKLEDGFVRTLAFTPDHQNLSCMKRAEIIVDLMRRMFPLPVAVISSLAGLGNKGHADDDKHRLAGWGKKGHADNSWFQELLMSVVPFCIWRMVHDISKNTFEVHVHIHSATKKKGDSQQKTNGKGESQPNNETQPKEAESGEAPSTKEKSSEAQDEVKCVFQNAFLQDSVNAVVQAYELQDAISNILHKDYGIVCIALADMPQHQVVPAPVPQNSSSDAGVTSSSASKNSSWEDFFSPISTSCLQSTKVLLKIPAGEHNVPEFFMLQQVIDIFKVYREVAADFFVDLKDELKLRMHGEDADQLCRRTHDVIKRSSPVSLLLYFHKMQSKSQQRLIQYLPEYFLRTRPVSEPGSKMKISCLGFSIEDESDADAVQKYEHDFQFPAFLSSHVSKSEKKTAWTTYFEYLYLNCGDDRPYAPCWDPIALQKQADSVFEAVQEHDRDKRNLENAKTLSELFDQYRKIVTSDLCLGIWGQIQKEQGYNTHDAIVLMNRLERAIRKVFYFTFCCKRIVLCSKCMDKFGLSTKEVAANDMSKDILKCSNFGAEYCQGALKKGGVEASDVQPSQKDKTNSSEIPKGQAGSHSDNHSKTNDQRQKLKEFCFRWFIKVAFNLKKACSTSLLYHRARLNMKRKNQEGEHPQNSQRKVAEFKVPDCVNLSSRDKFGFKKLDALQRSNLRNILFDIVEICGSGKLVLQEKRIFVDVLDLIIMAESVNKVVAECDVLKTGCSVYERFPNIGMSLNEKGDDHNQLVDKSSYLITHLMVAAVEGNAAKASAYISRADLDYISHTYVYSSTPDSRRTGPSYIASCALHMALERGNIDVANVIIDRICALTFLEDAFAWYPDQKYAKDQFLQTLFLGATAVVDGLSVPDQLEIPTSFMYLARYSMTAAMDKFIEILRHLKKVDEMNNDIRKYIVSPKDPNGLNALHYAVLSQSPSCVTWFIPYMHDFHPCSSSSKFTFVPDWNLIFPFSDPPDNVNVGAVVKGLEATFSFQDGFSVLLRLHPHSDFIDSDCRLAISEDWIQSYHYNSSNDGRAGLVLQEEHMEISPYELALLIWRVLDMKSISAQDVLHNLSTNSGGHKIKTKNPNSDPKKNANAALMLQNADPDSKPKNADPQIHSNQVAPEVPPHQSNALHAISKSSSAPSDKPSSVASQNAMQVSQESDTISEVAPERLAESFKQRSAAMYKILSELEAAAEEEVAIDAKKTKGLKRLARYRNNRAISRLVFPGLSYLLYVFFATLMAIIMTNGLFDEPTRFTHAVVEELGWGSPQKKINEIATFTDLTVFWEVLTGFLWGSSPMARSFGECNSIAACMFVFILMMVWCLCLAQLIRRSNVQPTRSCSCEANAHTSQVLQQQPGSLPAF
jgi:hypothetical protein